MGGAGGAARRGPSLPAPRAAAVRPRAADDQRARTAPRRRADDGHQGRAGGGGRALPATCPRPRRDHGRAVRRRHPPRRGRQPRPRRRGRADARRTSATCSWPGSSCSWTRPRRPRPRRCSGSRRSASRSRSPPATTRSWPRRSAPRSASTSGGTLTGTDIDALDDDALAAAAVAGHRLRPGLARAEGPRRARCCAGTAARWASSATASNDALALHTADVGISVDTATRRRQGRRRRHPAREGPRGARRRCRGGPAHLRQHHQVRADGHVEQLRQHVQRRGASAVLPFLPMLPSQILLNNLLYDAEPARHPHRPRRRGAAAGALALGHRLHPPVHALLRAAQLVVRLPHLRGPARGVPRRPGALPLPAGSSSRWPRRPW